jgi:peptidoglycan/xylan/chitin deacetylase (PgdA/CDA1 family)
MYFNNKNSYFHGIMFHHFHDEKIHPISQGSIDKNDFYKLINFIGRNNILDADIFFEKLIKGKLNKNDVCLTFDDGIKSQIDVALPVLEDLKIKSFFFTYTSMFEGEPDNIELYRYFRTNFFDSIDDFYENFYQTLDIDLKNFFEANKSTIKEIKNKVPVYTINDIKFRLVRDSYLDKQTYERLMYTMFEKKKFNFKDFVKKLFFQKDDIRSLNNLGHIIGLHTHSHPTKIENLSYNQQKEEYRKSISLLSKILNKSGNDIQTMSHPCGSYNKETLEILNDFGIKLGFKQIMTLEPEKGMTKINNSHLEIARQDHAQIIKKMKK